MGNLSHIIFWIPDSGAAGAQKKAHGRVAKLDNDIHQILYCPCVFVGPGCGPPRCAGYRRQKIEKANEVYMNVRANCRS
ncbi:hematopoietic cell signal transducer isoform 2-T2 [Spinachia spinachia]